MQKGKPTPHHRLTMQDVARDFQDGLLTPKGAIFYAVSAARKQGEMVTVNPANLAKLMGVKRSTYYRAISALTIQNRIEFEASEMVLRVPVDDDGTPIYFLENQSQKRDSQSQKRDSQSQKRDSQSQKRDSQSQKRDSQSQKRDSEPLEALSSNGSSAPLSIQSLQSIQSLKERENAREEEENGDRGFRDWLFNRANSLPQKPALMEQWIDKEMRKAANKREFAQYQASMAVAPIPAISQPENIASNDYWAEVEARRNGNG